MARSRSYWEFLKRCVSVAFPPWEKGQPLMAYLLPLLLKSFLALAALVGIGVAVFLPPLPAIVLVVFAVLVFLWAPYRVWATTDERLERLEERRRPLLKVSLDEPRLSPDGLRKFIRLRVDNEGHEAIQACQGKLLEVKPLEEIQVALPEPGQNLMWSTRGGDVSTVPAAKRAIDPKSHEYLDVAFTDNFLEKYNAGEIKEITPALLAWVRELLDRAFPYFNFVFADFRAWRIPEGAYDVTVSVSAANIETPTAVSFRIVYRNYLNLSSEALSTEVPPRESA